MFCSCRTGCGSARGSCGCRKAGCFTAALNGISCINCPPVVESEDGAHDDLETIGDNDGF